MSCLLRFRYVYLLLWLVIHALTFSARAHELPLSFIDLHVEADGIDVMIETSARNFAHDIPEANEAILLIPAQARKQRDRLRALLRDQFQLLADGKKLEPTIEEIDSIPERKDVRLRVHYSGHPSERIEVYCELFAFEASHKIFLNVYREETLLRQEIFSRENRRLSYALGERQSVPKVVRQFVAEGIHHIFIGPDHILFIVGLLLLGGSLGTLLRIVTAFTIAHSITLVLAALAIVSPPSRLIEPVIALSIVFVGVHAFFWRPPQRDWRLLFAFVFGFIHGFGFANVLREMALPPAALGWSLVSFNVGVEIGQACIVLAVAPGLAALHRRNAAVAANVVKSLAVVVVSAGSFWVVQRIFVAA